MLHDATRSPLVPERDAGTEEQKAGTRLKSELIDKLVGLFALRNTFIPCRYRDANAATAKRKWLEGGIHEVGAAGGANAAAS